MGVYVLPTLPPALHVCLAGALEGDHESGRLFRQVLEKALVLASNPALHVAARDKRHESYIGGKNGSLPFPGREGGRQRTAQAQVAVCSRSRRLTASLLTFVCPSMSPASVTLASTLQVRGKALSEEETWSLLLLAAEQIVEDLRNDSADYVVCPWSALLSAAGSLSFQGHVSHIEAAPFKAPELLQGQSDDEQLDVSQMHVYSLGMTMCEDRPCRRRPLHLVLEACRVREKEVAVYPAPASLHVRRLVGLVLGTISEVERRVVEESSSMQQNRSYLLRKRLHQASSASPAARALDGVHPCRVSERSTETQSSPEPHSSSSACSHCSRFGNGALPGAVSQDNREVRRLSSRSALSGAESSRPATPSQTGFLQRKGKFSRPEFVLLAGEAPVTLHLPGSVVTKKGKSYLALRDLCVVLLSGQCLEVKCDMASTAGAVFNAVTSFANLEEIIYFGLAYMKGKEFFFLDNETRLCEIAPEGWREQPQKTSMNTFTLFLRIKFFVSHYGLLQHSLTRHQFYLQLRKDILEERLCCNDETLLQLGVLALQAECGSYPKEQVESQEYFRVEDYIPASLIERMTALQVQAEVSERHRLGSALWGEDAELQFLTVTQQLPEYGVLVHRVFPEKKRPEGELALGICAKGVIVYEVKNSSRIATLRFQWRETRKISTYQRKFTITSSVTGKKHTFVTDSVKTCKYLLGLCSAQHGFNAQTGSGRPPQVLTDHDKFVQMANLSPAHQAQCKPLTWMQRLSCSENELFAPGLQGAAGGPLSTSLDNFHVEASKELAAESMGASPCPGRDRLEIACLIQKPTTGDPFAGPPVQSLCTGSQNNRSKSFTAEPGREIVCVTLKRDPQRGFGFVINEGENAGQADPGIFISAIIPGGPAEKAKNIKPGGQILALNHISLEGFTFSMAVRMIQNSPDDIELIISQTKGLGGLMEVEGGRITSLHPSYRGPLLLFGWMILLPYVHTAMQLPWAGSHGGQCWDLNHVPFILWSELPLGRPQHVHVAGLCSLALWGFPAPPPFFLGWLSNPCIFVYSLHREEESNRPFYCQETQGVCGTTPNEQKNSTGNSGIFSTDILSNGHQGSLSSHTQDQDRNIEGPGVARVQSLTSRLRPQLSPLPVKEVGREAFRVALCDHEPAGWLLAMAEGSNGAPRPQRSPFNPNPISSGSRGQLCGQDAGSSRPPSPSETKAGEIYFVELVKEDGTLGFSVTVKLDCRDSAAGWGFRDTSRRPVGQSTAIWPTGGINTSVLYGGIYVKSIVPGGPAAKEGQILQGEGRSCGGNSVSRGVESPGQRVAASRPGPAPTGKPPADDCLSRLCFPHLDRR
ncbi:FERM and PDZ domain-containing protein 2-like [Eulemur rufifrons]|uniref:FERM and PDZ domain-containing protein 2-like n=1 Tax=Eulemur rufifrons TaxID=859984 RepID=UPI00374490BA